MSSTLITIIVLLFWLLLVVAIGFIMYKLFKVERHLRDLAAKDRPDEECR